MALSRSLLADHVFQSPAGRPRKHGQQRHLLRAGDSARWRQPAQSPALPTSRSPGACSACLLHSSPPPGPPGPAGGRKGLVEGASGRTSTPREAKAPWRQLTEAFPCTHQAERTQEGRSRAWGRGRGLVNLVLGSWEGESIFLVFRHPFQGKNIQCKDTAKVSREALAKRAARVERARS